VRNVGYRFVPVKAERAELAREERTRQAAAGSGAAAGPGTVRGSVTVRRTGVRTAAPAR
jgi:hypothetical protein